MEIAYDGTTYSDLPDLSLPLNDRYSEWKTNASYLYDVTMNHNLVWPSACCFWDNRNSQEISLIYTKKTTTKYNTKSRLWSGDPDSIIISTVDIPLQNTTFHDHVTKFTENKSNNKINILKQVIHPGVILKLIAFPGNNRLLLTMADDNSLYFWNTTTQTQLSKLGRAQLKVANKPDVTLASDTSLNEYCLDAHKDMYVLSSNDKNELLLWDITSIQECVDKSCFTDINKPIESHETLTGATNIVDCCHFLPNSSSNIFCGVCRDGNYYHWDTRTSKSPIHIAHGIHKGEIYSVQYDPFESVYFATGGEDKEIHIYDFRMMSANLKTVLSISGHSDNVTKVNWNTKHKGYLESASDDGTVCIWDLNSQTPLFFRHGGHRGNITDFDSHPTEDWTYVSCSNDGDLGGGTVQVWRISEFITNPQCVIDIDE